PSASQRRHLVVQQLLDVHQPQGDQLPDEFDLGVQVHHVVLRSPNHPDIAKHTSLLAFTHSMWESHDRLLLLRLMVVSTTPSHHSGWSRFNFQLKIGQTLRDQGGADLARYLLL